MATRKVLLSDLINQSTAQRDKAFVSVQDYLDSAKSTGAKLSASMVEAGKYIASLWLIEQKQIADKKATAESIKKAKADRYALDSAFKNEVAKLISDATGVKYESARRSILRDVEKHTSKVTGFKKAVSQSDSATKAKVSRAKATPKATTKAKPKASPVKLTLASVSREVVDTMENLYDTVHGAMPEDIRKEYLNLQVAFIRSVTALVKKPTKTAPAK